jgi:hypothetical protein
MKEENNFFMKLDCFREKVKVDAKTTGDSFAKHRAGFGQKFSKPNKRRIPSRVMRLPL